MPRWLETNVPPHPGAKVLFLDHSLIYDREKYYNLAGQLILSNAIRTGAADPSSQILQIHSLSDEEALQEIRAFAPEVLCVSSYVWNTPRFLRLTQIMKQESPDMLIGLGGASALAVARDLYEGDEGLDFVIGGEGEEVFSQLLLEGYSPEMPGVFLRKEGKWQTARPVGVVANLETMPSPFDGHLNLGYPMRPVLMEGARGCPYSCTYCSWPSNGNKRLRSIGVRRMRQQVAWAVENNINHAWLLDAAINYEGQVFNDLMDAFQIEDPKKSLTTFFFLKYEFIKPGMAERIATALNTHEAHMPIESTNPVALKEVKRYFNAKRFEGALGELKAAEIRPLVEIMLGLPSDTLEGFKATLRYLVALEVNVNVFQVVAYPGCELYDKRDIYGFELAHYPLPMVLGTPTFSRSDMEQARAFVREISAQLTKSGASFSVAMEGPEASQDQARGPALGAQSVAWA